ncbi:MAG: Hsp70 family protein [Chloroflexi bacterium]|nr:Hsp70 family protein [Chloroflexota bacterium]MCI0579475.1 Hsp70 family protein [Chloroflexota bacterium]MCI0646254.1 Hsp70 family protein [Chloroflexota bacterium]MCI0732126.1 Hsp70 family protein [Chloroflexota bacterium]
MIVGMDFGTTNSGMAVYDGRQVQLLPLDPANANPHVARTALYVTNDQTVTIGREAVNRYFAQNTGRPSKMQRVWVGEVEVYGADMYYVTDVYAWVDVLSPGRLFLSIKTGLRDAEYQGTVVSQFYYSLENLVATYLSLTKIRVERLLGRKLRQVVLGRPVHFAADPKGDALAQHRLLDAAFRAGYEQVYLQYEPIAAAYHYAATVDRPQNILVFDFGGGTLDITVMRLGGRRGREVLATGGIPVAGDVFDRKLVRAKLPKHFGEGSRYGPRQRRLPLPKWIFDVFADWQRIIELQTPDSRKLLNEIAQTAEDRRGINALLSLVTNNYGLQMFDTVEAAKRRLSDDMATVLRLDGPGFHVTEMITRSEFEQIIRAEIQAIDQHLDEVVRDSGLPIGQIDAVVRTGGSAQIPAFKYMLMEKFGREKVMAVDAFSSVTSGLGIIAHGIAAGEMEAEVHTPAELVHPERPVAPPRVAPVNLELLQRRMAAQEEQAAGEAPGQEQALILLTRNNRLLASLFAGHSLAEEQPVSLAEQRPGNGTELQDALVMAPDEPLLLVTSQYRFLLTTPRHLLELQAMGLTAADFYHLKADEHICAFGHWAAMKQQSRLLLVTTRGFARSYPLEGLVESIEGPAALKFDRPLPGLPVAALGASPDDELVVMLDTGRAVRIRVGDLPLQGLQAINRREGERVIGALLAEADDEIVLVTADGYGRRLPAAWVPSAPKANSRGRVMIARRDVRGMARVEPDRPTWVVTPQQLAPVESGRLPLDSENSTKSYTLLKLQAGEEVLALL